MLSEIDVPVEGSTIVVLSPCHQVEVSCVHLSLPSFVLSKDMDKVLSSEHVESSNTISK